MRITQQLLISIILIHLSILQAKDISDNFHWLTVQSPQSSDFTDNPTAGTFSGIHNDALIIAGGSYFDNETEVFSDAITVITKNPGLVHDQVNTDNAISIEKLNWTRSEQTLTTPSSDGASATSSIGLICIGGDNSEGLVDNVVLLKWDSVSRKILKEDLPPLPSPVKPLAGILNDILYVSASIEQNGEYKNKFWALDIKKYGQEGFNWIELPPYTGTARVNAVSGIQDGSFYIIGGNKTSRTDNLSEKTTLTDCYRFTPTSNDSMNGTWTNIADIPINLNNAINNALPMGQEHLIIINGNCDKSEFASNIYAYHTITDTWRKIGEAPPLIGSANVSAWTNQFVIPYAQTSPDLSQGILIGQWNRVQKKFGTINWLVVISYFIFLILAGFYFSKREKDTENFYLGGRNVVWWAAGISTFGTGLSAITFMAIPAKAYSTDFIYFYSQIIAWVMIPVFVLYYVPFFQRARISTVYEYLEKRFNLILRLLAGAFFVLFQIFRMGIVVFLPAIALSTVTGLRTDYCIIIMGIISILYTVMGGIEAVIWTDVVQVIILMGGAIISLIIIISSADNGVSGFFQTALADGKLKSFDWSWDYTVPTVWVITIGRVIGHLNIMTSQDNVQRILATKDEKSANKVIYTNGACAVVSAVIFMLLGTGLYVFFKNHPHLLDPMMSHDSVLPVFIVTALPVGISGLIIAGIFAASMSSLDSGMNSGSQVIVNDFYLRIKPNHSQEHYLFVGKSLTVILGIIGTATALTMAISGDKIISLWDIFIKIIGLFTGPIAGLFAVGIFTKRTNGNAAIVSLILSVILLYYVQYYTKINFFLYGAIGVAACYALTYILSFIIPCKIKFIDGLTIYSMPPKI